MNAKRILSAIMALVMIISMMGVGVYASGNVAKVGDTEYATIDEAIANWTHGTTLTLLSDVTLSDVVTINSTEHHILDLGTYTMTAADGKNAFEIKACGTGDSERFAITIKADATNPGTLDAGKKSIIYYDYSKGEATGNDRPIIKIEGGNFKGATSSWGTAGIYTKGSAARKCATLNISGGTFDCSINGASKSKLIISGGTFNYSVGSQGDSTAYRQISGGRFKSLGFMTADATNKFWFGTSAGNFNVGVYVDDEDYLVVGGPVITEPGDKFHAVASNYGWNTTYLKNSSAATYGLYYTDYNLALADNKKGTITIFTDTAVNPETETVPEIKTNGSLTIDMSDEDATFNSNVKLSSAGDTFTVIFDSERPYTGTVTPAAGYGLKVTETMGAIVTRTYSNIECDVKIGNEYFETLDAALDYALSKGITKPEIEVLDDISFSNKLAQFEHVTFNGTNRKQTIDLNINSSFEANVGFTFNNLTISRMDADWLYHYFYAKGGLKFNDCKMLGLYNVTAQDTDFIDCDFYNDDTFGNGSYSIWLYNCFDGIEVNITDCSFDVYERAIKMYGDGYTGEMTLDISGTDFVSRTPDKTVVEMAYDNATTVGEMNLNITNSTKTGFGTPEHIDGEANAWFNVERSDNNYNNKLSTVKVDGEIVYPHYAAEIGTTKFLTLEEAVSSASDNDTIYLLTDVDISRITIDKDITIDLGGYTVTGSFEIAESAKVEIKNGEIVCENANFDTVLSFGNLTLTNVVADGERHVIRAKNGSLTINGGTYKYTGSSNGTRHALNIGDWDDKTSSVLGVVTATINDGTFTGPKGIPVDSGSALLVQNGSSATVNDGTFTGGKNKTLSTQPNATLALNGGYYDQEPDAAYLANGARTVYDDMSKLWTVIAGGHSIDIEAAPSTVFDNTDVTVTVKVNGIDFANAEWKLAYDKDVFEYVGFEDGTNSTDISAPTAADGVVTDKLYTYAYGNAFKGETVVVTYKFKSLTQTSDDVVGTFTLSDATVDTVISSNYGTTPVAGDSAEVTVKLRDFGALNFFENINGLENEITADIVNDTYTFEYDGAAHSFAVKVADDTITGIDGSYVITKDGVAVSEIKGVGTYEINYIISKDGYNTIDDTLKVVVTDPLFELETSTYTLGNHTLIMVYTNAPGMTPTFGGKAMFNITASGYEYKANDTAAEVSYDFVYGIVVPEISAGTTIADLRDKVAFTTNSVAVIDPYDANVNFTGPVDERDAVVVINTYGGYSEQMVYELLSRVLKADVNKDKVVNLDDVTEIERIIASK